MLFFVSLLVNGVLAGAIYALIALAFVIVYKSSRMINFAVGEWVMFGSLLVATGLHVLALGLGAAIILASASMIALAGVFGHVVLRRMTDRPLVAMIMITLGLGALMRGVAALRPDRIGASSSMMVEGLSHRAEFVHRIIWIKAQTCRLIAGLGVSACATRRSLMFRSADQ